MLRINSVGILEYMRITELLLTGFGITERDNALVEPQLIEITEEYLYFSVRSVIFNL